MTEEIAQFLVGIPIAGVLLLVWREERKERRENADYMREMLRAQMQLAEQVRDELQVMNRAVLGFSNAIESFSKGLEHMSRKLERVSTR